MFRILDNMYSINYIWCVILYNHIMKLGNNLKRCRFDHDDMSQDALAKEIGVSRQTIISIEKSKYVPSTLLAFKIAKYFGKSVEDVFYLIDNEK
jgi:putative transcriptional regulator